MKKIFALLTIAGMLFFFGCGSAQQKEATEEPEVIEEVVEQAEDLVEEPVEEVEEYVVVD